MTSKSQTLIERAWAKIDAAVTSGLVEPKGAGLETLVTVPTRPAELASHVRFAWDQDSGTELRARRLLVTADDVRELRLTTTVARGRLDPEVSPPELNDLGDWARKARQEERRWVVERLVAESTMAPGALDNAALGMAPPGSRVVALRAIEHLAEHCAKHGVEFVDASSLKVAGHVVALLWPADRFAVSRLEPFSLGWDITDNGDIDLILAERVELIGFTGASQTDVVRYHNAIIDP